MTTYARVKLTLHKGEGLVALNPGGTSNPFVTATIGKYSFSSKVVEKTCNPLFDGASFDFECCPLPTILTLKVYNKLIFSDVDDPMGSGTVTLFGTCGMTRRSVPLGHGGDVSLATKARMGCGALDISYEVLGLSAAEAEAILSREEAQSAAASHPPPTAEPIAPPVLAPGGVPEVSVGPPGVPQPPSIAAVPTVPQGVATAPITVPALGHAVPAVALPTPVSALAVGVPSQPTVSSVTEPFKPIVPSFSTTVAGASFTPSMGIPANAAPLPAAEPRVQSVQSADSAHASAAGRAPSGSWTTAVDIPVFQPLQPVSSVPPSALTPPSVSQIALAARPGMPAAAVAAAVPQIPSVVSRLSGSSVPTAPTPAAPVTLVTPAPAPTLTSVPAPASVPTMTSVPAPAPAPTLTSIPAPASLPSPASVPTMTSVPAPAPAPHLTSVPTPASVPSPASVPTLASVQTPPSMIAPAMDLSKSKSSPAVPRQPNRSESSVDSSHSSSSTSMSSSASSSSPSAARTPKQNVLLPPEGARAITREFAGGIPSAPIAGGSAALLSIPPPLASAPAPAPVSSGPPPPTVEPGPRSLATVSGSGDEDIGRREGAKASTKGSQRPSSAAVGQSTLQSEKRSASRKATCDSGAAVARKRSSSAARTVRLAGASPSGRGRPGASTAGALATVPRPKVVTTAAADIYAHPDLLFAALKSASYDGLGRSKRDPRFSFSGKAHTATQVFERIRQVDPLLSRGFDEVRDFSGRSLLHLAAWLGNIEVLKTLLSPNPIIPIINLAAHVSSNGNTILHAAAQGGQAALCEWILYQSGMDKLRHCKNSKGLLPRECAVAAGFPHIARILDC